MFKLAYALLFIAAIVAMLVPEGSRRILSPSIFLVMLAVFFVGLHFYNHAGELSEGNVFILYLSKILPLALPSASYVIWLIFKS